MHKSGEYVLGNVGNLERINVVPTMIPEAPQMMNTCGEPNTL